ncbi:PQQ-binding-like beta-propeller repeat protein [Streptomyces sp. S1D4-11]
MEDGGRQCRVLVADRVRRGDLRLSSDDGNLYAVDAATGKQRWKFPIGRRTLSSPTVFDGVVYVGGGDRHLYAVNSPTGKQRWKFATGGPCTQRPP